MRKYLSEIHTKSEKHKTRFALATSAGVTLLIFTIWSAVKFGPEPVIVKENTGPVNLAAVNESVKAGSPFSTIFSGIGETWDSLKDIYKNAE